MYYSLKYIIESYSRKCLQLKIYENLNNFLEVSKWTWNNCRKSSKLALKILSKMQILLICFKWSFLLARENTLFLEFKLIFRINIALLRTLMIMKIKEGARRCRDCWWIFKLMFHKYLSSGKLMIHF